MAKALTKSQIVVEVAESAEISKKQAVLALETLSALAYKNAKNGFTVTGESACVSPENFDAAIGRNVARANAINKVWPLMGYALKERMK